MAGRALKTLGLAAGVAATIAGAAYTSERVALRRLRRNPDSDAADELVPAFDEIRSLASHDGGSISVISRGEGPAIVLSHGVTLSVRTWVKQMESLPAAGFRAVAFDHRGHGASTVGADGHTLDTLAGDVRTVVEGLDLRDAVIVGHSMGGVAVQLFCLRFPEVAAERVAGIVLLSTMARTALSGNRRLLTLLDRVAAAAPDASGVLGFSNLGLLVARIGFGRNPQPSHVELTRQMILACASETRKRAAGPLLGLDLSSELPRLTVPTLVICGTNDVLTPPAEARRIAWLVPGARLEMLDGAGHMAMLEQSETVDRLITDFAHEMQGKRPDVTGNGHGRRAGARPRGAERGPNRGAVLSGSITDVPGLRAGSVTLAGTGVTVVLLPERTIGSCEVRGGAPASRETALLEATKLVEHVDAIVLTGGSAFGLATADGVMTHLAARDRGFRSSAGPVPIVPTAAIFDLVASGGVHPRAEDGAAAADAAAAGGALATGRVGAGTGATVGKWRGAHHGVPGGMGSASRTVGDATVGAVAVVNAIGDVIDAAGAVLAGSSAPPEVGGFPDPPLGPGESTTLVVVATDAACSKVQCQLLAQSAHDGLARSIRPVATRFDGDIAFAVATGAVAVHFDRLRLGVVDVVADAVRAAVS